MELQLRIVSYITANKMLFTSKAIILNKTDNYLQADAYKSEILTIEMNPCVSK
jgi:hypothetical protein